MAELDTVLKEATNVNASDLHLAPGEPFIMRQCGRLVKIEQPFPYPRKMRTAYL